MLELPATFERALALDDAAVSLAVHAADRGLLAGDVKHEHRLARNRVVVVDAGARRLHVAGGLPEQGVRQQVLVIGDRLAKLAGDAYGMVGLRVDGVEVRGVEQLWVNLRQWHELVVELGVLSHEALPSTSMSHSGPRR